jgi:DNA polymerase-3 subunit epsilon
MVAVKYRQYRHRFENFQLMTVAKKLNIDIDESQLHNALYDAEVTKAVYKKCIS